MRGAAARPKLPAKLRARARRGLRKRIVLAPRRVLLLLPLLLLPVLLLPVLLLRLKLLRGRGDAGLGRRRAYRCASHRFRLALGRSGCGLGTGHRRGRVGLGLALAVGLAFGLGRFALGRARRLSRSLLTRGGR